MFNGLQLRNKHEFLINFQYLFINLLSDNHFHEVPNIIGKYKHEKKDVPISHLRCSSLIEQDNGDKRIEF